MLEKLAAADLDVIVIEASGLAEPSTLVRMALQAPGVTYGGLIYVVDAVEYSAVPHLDRDLALADLVVLNKVDRVSSPPSFPVDAPVLPVSYGRIDPALLFEVRPPDRGPRQLSFDDLDDHSSHAHALYDSVSFESVDFLHPRLFMDFLQARPSGLFRAKGFAQFPHGTFMLHVVGSFISFTPVSSRPYPAGTDRDRHRRGFVDRLAAGMRSGRTGGRAGDALGPPVRPLITSCTTRCRPRRASAGTVCS